MENRHYFCSNDCRQDWYRNVFSQSEDWKLQSKTRAARILRNGNIKSSLTLPHRRLNEILDGCHLEYINEYPVGYYSIDTYVQKYNLMIEVMGDFWHCSPIKYHNPKYPQQVKRIQQDGNKREYVKEQYQSNILYL